MTFQTSILLDGAGDIAAGVGVTLLLAATSFLFALVLGVVVGTVRRRPGAVCAALGGGVSFFRGTPLLIQLFLLYYGLPAVGLNLPRWPAAILGLGLNGAAYIAEIIRGSLLAVAKGQEDAARSLGLSSGQTLRLVLLPQALRVSVPALVNSFSATLKDTSLVSVLSIMELTRVGQLIYTRTYRAFEIYLAVAVLYYLLVMVVALFSKKLEKRLAF